jgi:hypothetical protein
MLQALDDRFVSAQLPRLELVRSNPEERVNHRFANTIAGVVLVKLPPVTQNQRSTPKIIDAELDFALVISRLLCLAMHLVVFALLFVLLDNAPLIMHGVIWGGQTHNRGYVNTYSYLCFTPHLCTFHQSICRSSTRY